MNGVDVSYWDKGLTIGAIEADFVICKATEGTSFTDPTFSGFAHQVINARRLLGAYHFARSTSEPEDQADYFISVVRPFLGRVTLWLDWENAEGYDDATLDLGPSWALRWLRRVRNVTGVIPGIYTSKSVCNSYDWEEVAREGYPLWGAEYANMSVVNGYQAHPWQSKRPWGAWGALPSIHQYTGQLALPGASVLLDGDLAHMTKVEWEVMAEGEEDEMTSEERVMLKAIYDAIVVPTDASGRGKKANVPDRLAWIAAKQEAIMKAVGAKWKD